MSWIKSIINKIFQTSKKTSPVFKESWKLVLRASLKNELHRFNNASDIRKLRSDWDGLEEDQKLDCLVMFFMGIAYFESSYYEDVYTKGVSGSYDKNTFACGLYQMSVLDQAFFKTGTTFLFKELLIGENNCKVAVKIMLNQIYNTGKIFLKKGDSGVFWAVILSGGKTDKTEIIISSVRNLKFESRVTKIEDTMPWMAIAENELGQMETVKENPRIIEYHSATSLKAQSQKVAWCASFACWVLKKAGYKSTGTSWARDFLDYGTKLEQPKKGCIMVFERNGAGGDSHVTFWTGEEATDSYLCMGGNQSDSVCKRFYAKKDLLGCRWPIK